MKNITVKLNSKSIKEAIKALNQEKKTLQEEAIPEFMTSAALWIINRANEILRDADIGDKIKRSISLSWRTKWVNPRHLVLYNKYWKSPYVEFGVGLIGEYLPHPSASQTNWEYNIETKYKDAEGGWAFTISDMSELDLPQDAIDGQDYVEDEMLIYTQGTQGVWYLFNAVEDFKSRKAQSLWESIKRKYWG